jgi:Ca2+-binding RTX toxin-like protein
MAYNDPGSNGSDTLDHFGDTGPGTITGLGGDDSIFLGTGNASVLGGSGRDSILLQTGNSGTVDGGSEDDIISDRGTADLGNPIDDNGFARINPMLLRGGSGADTIIAINATTNQTIIGGIDSSDGADFIIGGIGRDLVFGNGGNDELQLGGDGTAVGGHGDDIVLGGINIFGNEGDDLITPNDDATVVGGQGNDIVTGFSGGSYFGNEGADTLTAFGPATLQGGIDSADGGDFLTTFEGASLFFGNGGADTILPGLGANTVVAGAGDDTIEAVEGDDLILGNEGNDSVFACDGNNTVVGGQGDDTIFSEFGFDVLIGSEGNDTVEGGFGSDTITGGTGNDVFIYDDPTEDGILGLQPIERLTDVNYNQDQIFTPLAVVTFARNYGNLFASQGTLLSAAEAAISTAFVDGGGDTATTVAAASFTFGGRTFLAVDQDGFGFFDDFDDLLLDVTGATGTLSSTTFI